MPAALLAELVPVRPSRVPREVYREGPTARALRCGRSAFVVVQAVGEAEDRHAAEPGADQTLCGLFVWEWFPLGSLLIVKCRECEDRLPSPHDLP